MQRILRNVPGVVSSLHQAALIINTAQIIAKLKVEEKKAENVEWNIITGIRLGIPQLKRSQFLALKGQAAAAEEKRISMKSGFLLEKR